MTLREPAVFTIDPSAGELRGATSRYRKMLADLDGLYADEAAFAQLCATRGSEVVYEVTDHRPSTSAGDLILGVTRMAPGTVGAEFFLTRGHIHARADRPEMYRGEAGHGLMLLESPEGDVRVVEMRPGTVCDVPPFWIHRSVNVGSGDLVLSFAYPADAGQDYDIIARSGGMRRRIVADGHGGWTAVDNPAWRPRSGSEVAALMGTAA